MLATNPPNQRIQWCNMPSINLCLFVGKKYRLRVATRTI